MARWKRWALGSAAVLGTLVVLMLVLVLGVVAYVTTPKGSGQIASRVEAAVDAAMTEGDFQLGAMRVDRKGRVTLRDVAIVDAEGHPLVTARKVAVRVDLWAALDQHVHLPVVRAEGVVVDLDTDSEGILNLSRLFGQTEPSPPSEEPWTGLGLPVDVDLIELHTVAVRYRVEGQDQVDVIVDGRASMTSRGTDITLHRLDLLAVTRAPVGVALKTTGSLAYTGESVVIDGLDLHLPGSRATISGTVGGLDDSVTMDLGVAFSALDLRSIDPIAGNPGIRGVYYGDIEVSGPMDALTIGGALEGKHNARGRLSVEATVDAMSEDIPWSASLNLESLRVDDAYPGVGSDLLLNGVLEVQGSGSSYPDGLEMEGTYHGGAQTMYGLDLRSLAVAVRLEQGKLAIKDLSIDGVVGRLDARGGFDLQTGRLEQTVTGTLDLSELAAFGVTGLAGRGPMQLHVKGDVFAAGAPVDVTGSTTLYSVSYGEDVRFEEVEVAFVVEVRDGETHVEADVTGTDASLYGAALVGLEIPDLIVDARADGTTVSAKAMSLGALSYDDQLSLAGGVGGLRIESPAVGDTAVTLGLSLSPVTFRHLTSPGGSTTVELRGDDLSVSLDLRGEGEVPLLGLSAAMDLQQSSLVVDRLSVAPRPEHALSATAPIRATLVDGGATGVDVALASTGGGTLTLRGDLRSEGPMDATVHAEAFDLAVVSGFAPEAGELRGLLDAEIGLRGTATEPEADVVLGLIAFGLDDTVQDLDLDLTGTLSPSRLDLTVDAGADGETYVSVDGEVPLTLRDGSVTPDPDLGVDVAVILRPGDLQRFERWLPDTDIPRGEGSAVLVLNGPLTDPDADLRGVFEAEIPGWSDLARIELDVRVDGRQTAWWLDLRDGYEPMVAMVGTASNRLDEVVRAAVAGGEAPDPEDYGVYADDLDISVMLLDMPMQSLLATGQSDLDVRGDLVGGVSVTGSWHSPRVEGAFNWLDGAVGGAMLDGAYIGVTPVDGGYALDTHLAFAGDGTLGVSGTIPLALDLREDSESWTEGEIDLAIQGERVPLSMLRVVDPGITEATGDLNISGSLVGPMGKAFPAFNVEMQGGVVTYEPLGVRYEDIVLDLRADETRFTVHRLQLRTVPLSSGVPSLLAAEPRGAEPKPNLVISGSVLLDDGSPSLVDLLVDLDDAWLAAMTEDRFRVKGRIRTTGRWPALKVATEEDQDLVLQSGLVAMDAAAFLSAGTLRLDDALRVHRGEEEEEEAVVGAEAEQAEEVPSALDELELDIGIDLARALEVQMSMPYIDDLGALGAAVTRADMSARLGGQVRLTLAGGEPAILGEVEIIEGQVRIMRSQFGLEQGTIAFVGGDYSDPSLDLDAVMQVTGGSVEMRIGGRPSEPIIDLKSAEFPDQTQILTILLTGRSPEDMSESQGNATAGALAGLLLNSVLGGSRLGSVTIDPDGSLRVVLPPVARNVYGESVVSPQAALDENRYSVEVEWAVLRRLVVEASYGDVSKTADLFWELRF